jgi:hypothetical protein
LGLLQLDADALSQFAVVAAPREAKNLHISRIRFEQPFENFDGGRFSGTVRTEKPETFAATDLERQAIDGDKVAILLDQIGAGDAGHDPGHCASSVCLCSIAAQFCV